MSDRGYLAIVANSRFYAGPYRIADQTRIDDGLLDVVLYKRRSVAAMLRLLAGILFNRTRFLRDVAYYRCTEVRAELAPPAEDADGRGQGPEHPGAGLGEEEALSVLVPRQRAAAFTPRRS